MTRKKPSTESARKKETTIEERQQKLKEKLLKILEKTPIVQYAVMQTGIDRSTYYRWREDEAFRERAEKALDVGRDLMNDVMESLLTKIARGGNMTALIFWLKNNNQRYATRVIHRYEPSDSNDLTPEQIADIQDKLRRWAHPQSEYAMRAAQDKEALEKEQAAKKKLPTDDS